MSGTITVELNELSIEIEEKATLGELLTKTQTTHNKGTTIGIVKWGGGSGKSLLPNTV